MTTDFCALCYELHAALEKHNLSLADEQLLDRSAVALRAAMSQPEPEGPTVMEIIELADQIEESGLGQVDLVRAALARWGSNTSRSI